MQKCILAFPSLLLRRNTNLFILTVFYSKVPKGLNKDQYFRAQNWPDTGPPSEIHLRPALATELRPLCREIEASKARCSGASGLTGTCLPLLGRTAPLGLAPFLWSVSFLDGVGKTWLTQTKERVISHIF